MPAAPIGLHSFGGAAGAATASTGAPAAAAAGAAPAAGGLPGVPTGLAALNAAAMANMQATLFGMGAAPVTKEVALVTVPRLDDLIIKALADNYHRQCTTTHRHHGCLQHCAARGTTRNKCAQRMDSLMLLFG